MLGKKKQSRLKYDDGMKIYKDIEMMNPFCRVLVVIMKSKKYGVESVKM